MQLNGWQRVWVVFAVLTFTITTIFVYLLRRDSSLLEDADIVAAHMAKDEMEVQIPGIGIVAFPGDKSKTEIETLIRENYKTRPAEIPKLARQMKRETYTRQAESNKATNEQIRKANRNVILYGYSAWIILIVLIYIAGWVVGWVYRGFKPT
jgi:hypothetical protein